MGCNISGKVVLISVIELGPKALKDWATRILQSTLHQGRYRGIFLLGWKGLINVLSLRPRVNFSGEMSGKKTIQDNTFGKIQGGKMCF